MIFDSTGNIDIMNLTKIAFLCSKKYPASSVLKCYEWAVEMRDKNKCVIGGFHSQLEKDVLHYLLKGNQPVIKVLARGIMQRVEKKLIKHIDDGRLFIISPFNKSVKRITTITSMNRNKYIIDITDEIVIGYCDPNGNLNKLLCNTNKKISYL